MTNKRQLKKFIAQVGDEVATLILPAAIYTKTITEEHADAALNKLSALQAEALSKVSIAYDKAATSFETMSQYKAAKAKYYRTAYGKLLKEYEDGINSLLTDIKEEKK